MQLRSIRNIKKLKGKRVLLRLDLNAPIKGGRMEVADLWKLKAALPTLKLLKSKKAIVVIVSHLGRPKGHDHDLSLRSVIKKLSQLAGLPIKFWPYDIDDCEERLAKLSPGSFVALENMRFHHEEYEDDARFAKKLSRLADVFVNDAFGNVHRKQASQVAVTRYLPSYAGLLMEYEVHNLHGLLRRVRHPAVAIMGGNKISTKIRLIKKMLRSVDWLLLGGALANTVLAGMDYSVGRSRVEEDMVSWSKSLMNNRLKLPVDARAATSPKAKERITAIGTVRKNEIIYDLGPDTIELFANVIKKAKTVIWNGPLGMVEDRRYAKATNELVQVLANTKAKVYVGGGETVEAVLKLKLESKIDFISTGGGAMLSLLEGQPLPALRPLTR